MSSLAEIKLNIAKLAQNDPILEYSLPSFKELQGVVKTMNKVSRQITEKNSETANKLEELTEVFDSIKIGIILILQEERIARINRAACKILNIGLLNPVGKTVQEVIVDGNLQHFISSALQSILPLEDEIIIWKSNISLQIYSAPLNNSQGEKIGILVVLNDISYMRKLENVRKDFVANVSHELRTPITAIKGFIETLLENRIEDKEEIHRFLNIINKHTNRLNNIIDDLMLLAKMEAGENAIPLTTENLYEILKGVVEKCQDKALAKNISLELQGPRELNLRINPTLIEQAVVNLIDNAVKFSNDNSKVEIKVEPAEKELVISVKDYGIGIDPEHLPRLFERFYRVDRSRSRMEGGTGLGLSIVKHIALTHKGEVSVSSIPGEGSEFRIHLPR
jgi:two-component system phosphate regulon sensor histidine kinase PhoR